MRSRPSLPALLAIAALVVFTIWITWRAKVLESGSQPGGQSFALLRKPAPDFSLPTLDNRTISLADYRGKKLVVSFWASWCGPCRLEMPVLRSFYERAHKPGAEFDFLAISLDEDRGAAERAANQMKLPFPIVLDPEQKTAGTYGVYGIPTLFVIDKGGRVAYAGAGFNPALEVILAAQLGIDPKTITPEGAHVQPGH